MTTPGNSTIGIYRRIDFWNDQRICVMEVLNLVFKSSGLVGGRL